MADKRVLFLGITGINKSDALNRLSAHCHGFYGRDPAPRIVDFEDDYLFPQGGQRSKFLSANPMDQRTEWERGWADMSDAISDMTGDIFLSMHGCYIRGHYGSRWILDPNSVAEFRPDLIVTLIADVYDMWTRTEKRADGEDWRGRPSPEQLVLGRRFEVAVGDQIALSANCRHLVLAVEHPCDTLARCVFKPNVKVAYLSFPISEPRRMAKKGDFDGIKQVSDFIAYAHQRQSASQQLACVCPLAIDELPFVFAMKEAEEDFANEEDATDEKVKLQFEFDRDGLRWNLSDFWPSGERMGRAPEMGRPFPLDDVRDAAGSIRTDVTWRDYRLVEQADCLAVFNPVFNNKGEVSHGVANEIAFATSHYMPVYFYQDPKHDKAMNCDSALGISGGGTMLLNPGSALIVRRNSLEELFDAILKK